MNEHRSCILSPTKLQLASALGVPVSLSLTSSHARYSIVSFAPCSFSGFRILSRGARRLAAVAGRVRDNDSI